MIDKRIGRRIKERREESKQSSDLRALANKYREKKGYEG